MVAAVVPLHTELDTSSPEADAVLDEVVREVRLTFTTSVNAQLSTVTVSRADGSNLASSPVEHPPGREDQIRVRLDTPLESGSFRVDWRALAPDGHVVEGGYNFAVALADDPSREQDAGTGAPGPSSGPTPPQATDIQPGASASAGDQDGSAGLPGGTWIRWLQLFGVVVLVGASGARFAVLPTTGLAIAHPEARARMLKGFARFAFLATMLLLVALPLRLMDQVGSLSESAGVSQGLVLLFETAWGAGWLLQLGAITLAVFGLALTSPRGQRTRGWVIVVLAALVLPLASALQGHAWGQEEARALAVLSLYLHILGSGLWLGGLFLLVIVGLPALAREKRREAEDATTDTEESIEEEERISAPKPALARLVNAFSRVALPAVVLVVASGAVNAWLTLGGIEALFASPYGRTLLLKLAFVTGALLLGFYNWRRVRPTLVEQPQPGALRIPASVEAALGIVILFVTAVLVATPTP